MFVHLFAKLKHSQTKKPFIFLTFRSLYALASMCKRKAHSYVYGPYPNVFCERVIIPYHRHCSNVNGSPEPPIWIGWPFIGHFAEFAASPVDTIKRGYAVSFVTNSTSSFDSRMKPFFHIAGKWSGVYDVLLWEEHHVPHWTYGSSSILSCE